LSYELEFHEDNMQALQKGVEKYVKKAIAKVLPLSMFDDYKTESVLLQEMIEDRRRRNKKQLVIRGLQQDGFGDETLISGTCLDYVPALE
jgi:archaellum biogenesis ATPase FlaH